MSEAEPNSLEHDETADLGDSPGVRGGPHYEPLSEEQCPLHSSDSPLHKAAYKGDALSLASPLFSCENIDAQNYYDCTPLHLAIRGNHAGVVGLLLSAGADSSLEDFIDAEGQAPRNAVDLAAWTGAQHAMAALIDAGLKIPASAFERCASLNHVDCMETIFDKLSEYDFSDRSRIDVVNSALHRAALCWHLEAVEFLPTRVTGFPEGDDPKHQTALGEALAATSDLEFICIDECRWWPGMNPVRFSVIKEKLIAAGADIDIERNEAFWRAAGDSDTIRDLFENGLRHDSHIKEGYTPLFGLVSAENDDISLVEAFIADGADVNHRDEALRTPMHYAANQATAEALYQHGAGLFAKDKSGMTPLHTACKNGYFNVVQFLLSKGAAVYEAAIAGHTPLLYVIFDGEDQCEAFLFPPIPYTENSRLEVAKILLDYGANIHAATADGQTVLHGAVWFGDTEFIRYLVEHGANVWAIAANGETPLHNAACTANIEAVRYLIDQGADAHVVTTDGETTVHAACAVPNSGTLPSISHILGTLLDRGVDVNARDATGSTALHLLYELCYRHHRCSTETCNLLLQRGADRLVANNKGENVLELIKKDEKWDWDAEGFLKTK